MAAIPEEIVDRVKNEANIVDVISDYVRLRRTGKNWLGLCPFHDDKKPSFHVEPQRGIFKCFACGKGGNVFTFLMELNGWTFPETVRSLAQALGIEIPEDTKDRQQYSDNERLAAAVRDAADFYLQTLRSDTGLAAQAYFRKRGLTDETITRFGLGYSPDDWEQLLNRLTQGGYSPQELERAGLVIKREGRSGWYDRFRGRAMFPIFTTTGRVVGFGARRMKEDPDQPKYINSSESPIYQKSRVLYGLFQAKDAIRRSGMALLVEGYIDVISLHQSGINTAIATCGTAIATEHADLISRYCTRVVLVFDSDLAGQNATERGIDVLLRKGIDVSVLRLPDGEDPDTFVQKFGQKEFERRIGESTSFLEFLARRMKNAGDFDAPDRQTESIRAIVSTISLIPDALKRELYIQKLAADYHLPEALMAQEVERALGEKAGRRRRELLPKPATPPIPEEDAVAIAAPAEPAPMGEPIPPARTARPVPPKPVTRSELPSAEIGLLNVLLHGDPQLLEHVFARIDPDDFAHPLTRELVGLVLGHYVNQRSFTLDELVMEDLSPELRDLITLLAIERESISDHWVRSDPEITEPNPWKIARDCLIRIEQESIDRESRSIQDTLLNPELTDEKRMETLNRFMELRRRHEELGVLISG
ncbi:MAG: primase [Chlorobi bacterium]|nr:primase [Chlorobiota bacterium]